MHCQQPSRMYKMFKQKRTQEYIDMMTFEHFQHGSKAFNPPYLYHKIYNQPARQQHLHRFTTGTIDSSDELLATLTAAGLRNPGGLREDVVAKIARVFPSALWEYELYIYIILSIYIYIIYYIYTSIFTKENLCVFKCLHRCLSRIGRPEGRQCDAPSHGSP